MIYVVKVLKGIRGTSKSIEEYLCAIRHDRYQTGNTVTHSTSPYLADAFKFDTLAAAEMAAVFVGGKVIEEPL